MTISGSAAIATGSCSFQPYSIGLVAADGNTGLATGQTTIALVGSGSVLFYSSTNCSGSPITSVTIGKGYSQTSFYIKDSSAESVTINANSTGLGSSNLPVSILSSKQAFTFSGADQTFTVPTAVSSLIVSIWGAGGGTGTIAGGSGGFAYATLPVTPGEQLTVRIGGGGVASSLTASSCTPTSCGMDGAGGGGGSGVLRGSTIIAMAGGGGGSAGLARGSCVNGQWAFDGGGGSGDGGDNGITCTGFCVDAGSASTTAGGTGGSFLPGAAGTFGQGGDGSSTISGSPGGGSVGGFGGGGSGGHTPNGDLCGSGGGGGGGYYGGGGGPAPGVSDGSQFAGGGGGGSGYVEPTATGTYYLLSGDSSNPPGMLDPDWNGAAAYGGAVLTANGSNGLVVIRW